LFLLRKEIDRCMGIKEEPEQEKVRWVASPNGTLIFKGKLSGETQPKTATDPQASTDGEKPISGADKAKKTEQESKPTQKNKNEENQETFREAANAKSSDKKKIKHDSSATADGTDGSWKNRTLEDALSSLGDEGLDDLIYGKKRRKDEQDEDINENDEKWMDWID